MMAHFASGTYALFDEDIENHMGTIGGQYFSYDRYDKLAHKDKGAFGSTFIVAGCGAEDERSRRLRQCAPRPVRPGARRLHEARQARAHPHHGVRRGDAEHREPHRARERQGRVRHAARPDHPQLRRGRGRRCGTPTSRRACKIAKATDAKEVWSARGNMPTIHLFGGTIMGTGAGNSVVDSYGQTHEIAQPLRRRPRHLPDRGRAQPDLHDLRAVAARRRAPGGELVGGRSG